MDTPVRGILLSDYKPGAKRPCVFPIWELDYSQSLTKVGLVCIHSNRRDAESRVRGLNSNSFWKDSGIQQSKRYKMEECEVDHYSSMLYSEMMGYDLADSRVHDQIVHETLWYPMSDEGRIERIREAAREKIEALEKRVAELESELDRTK